jgi:hypothetical protein
VIALDLIRRDFSKYVAGQFAFVPGWHGARYPPFRNHKEFLLETGDSPCARPGL